MFLNNKYFYGLNDLRKFLKDIGTIVESAEADETKLDKIAAIVRQAEKPLNGNVNTSEAVKDK